MSSMCHLPWHQSNSLFLGCTISSRALQSSTICIIIDFLAVSSHPPLRRRTARLLCPCFASTLTPSHSTHATRLCSSLPRCRRWPNVLVGRRGTGRWSILKLTPVVDVQWSAGCSQRCERAEVRESFLVWMRRRRRYKHGRRSIGRALTLMDGWAPSLR